MPDNSLDRMHGVFDVSHGEQDPSLENQSAEAGKVFELSQLLRQQGSPPDLHYSLGDPSHDAHHRVDHLENQQLSHFHVQAHRAL